MFDGRPVGVEVEETRRDSDLTLHRIETTLHTAADWTRQGHGLTLASGEDSRGQM